MTMLTTILYGTFVPPECPSRVIDNLGMNAKATEIKPRRTCLGQRSDVERYVNEAKQWVTANDVATVVDMTTTNIRYHLDSLASKGLILERVKKVGRHYKRLYRAKSL